MAGKWSSMAKELKDKAVAFKDQHKPTDAELAAAKAWTVKAASETAAGAVRMGKDSLKTDLGKNVATGAGLGAIAAVPVPLIGPVVGAIVGGGVGAYLHMTRARGPVLDAPTSAATSVPPTKDIYAELMKLDDLHKKGILTEQEFAVQKAKVLGGN